MQLATLHSGPGFEQPGLHATLEAAGPAELDALSFGVVRMDAAHRVLAYGAAESRASGLRPETVLGRDFFVDVAPCMNNFLVALRFETEAELDETIDFVLTFRMRPTPVRLRLLASRLHRHRYVLIERAVAAPR